MFRQRNRPSELAPHVEGEYLKSDFLHTPVSVKPLLDKADTLSEVDVLYPHSSANRYVENCTSQHEYDGHSADLFGHQRFDASYSPAISSSSSSSLPLSGIYSEAHPGQYGAPIPVINFGTAPSVMPATQIVKAILFEPKIDFPVTEIPEDSATPTTADQKHRSKSAKQKSVVNYMNLYRIARNENTYFREVIARISYMSEKGKKHSAYLNEQLKFKDNEIEKLTTEITALKKIKRKRIPPPRASTKNKIQKVSQSNAMNSQLQLSSVYSSPAVLFQPNITVSVSKEEVIPALVKISSSV
jgi:hypothetical protein